MTLDENRWQRKLARKRKTQASGKPQPQRSNVLSPTQAAHRPIHDALIAKDLFKLGMGMVGLARTLPDGDVAVATFLVDVYCLGVKDAFYRVLSPEDLAQLARQFNLEKAHPGCVRKLVEGAVAYASDLGLPPHADYARAAQLFGSIEAAACPVRYSYGKDGKPFYIPGPNTSPAQSRRIVNALTRRHGEQGFHYLTNGEMVPGTGDGGQPATPYDYQITRAPLPDSEFGRLPRGVQARIYALYDEIRQPRPSDAVAALKALIEQYPNVPSMYNFLYAAHHKLGEHAAAMTVLGTTLERFPDYLFARIALANECLSRGASNEIAAIFDDKFDLKLLYPERTQFHITEVLGFENLVARYFHALGDRERARQCYDRMCQVDPQHPATQQVEQILSLSGFGNWLRNKLLRR